MEPLEKKILAGMGAGAFTQIELTRLIFENPDNTIFTECALQLTSLALNLIPYTGRSPIIYGIGLGVSIVVVYDTIKNRYNSNNKTNNKTL